MLNKPTNVSPYNEFIDINNGLEFTFSLNNIVDGICIELYDEENTHVFSDLIINTEKKRDFTYVVPDEKKSLLLNGKNYYWKTRYWREPKEEDRCEDEFLCVNYWDSKRQLVGLLPNQTYFKNIASRIQGTNKQLYDNCEIFSTTIKEVSFDGSVAKIKIDDNFTPYKYIERNFFYFCIPDIKLYMVVNSFSPNGQELTFEKNMIFLEGKILFNEYKSDNEFLTKLNDLLLNKTHNGIIVRAKTKYMKEKKDYELSKSRIEDWKFEEDGIYMRVASGSSIIIYGLKSFDGANIYDFEIIHATMDGSTYYYCFGTPSLGFSVNSYYFPLEEGVTYYDQAAFYNKCEYNESPPYYFSCIETPAVSLNKISTNKPQIELCATFDRYIDVNSYYYQVYRIHNSNDSELIWESNKLNSITPLDDDKFGTESVIYKGITPGCEYKVKLIGQTFDGVDFEAEYVFKSSNFGNDCTSKDFIFFDKNLGCIQIDESVFIIPKDNNNIDELDVYERNVLEVYRYNTVKNELDFVHSTPLMVNAITTEDGLCKDSYMYDFNIVSDVEYIYYAFIRNGNEFVQSFVSSPITPSWSGVYLTNVNYSNSIQYIPELSEVWFLGLNFESGEVVRNYQISHPLGIGQKYPKSVRGSANFKTGQISGLIGGISRTGGDYEEDTYLIEKFEAFCADGKPKLIRSNIKGEHLIADIDKMSSFEFGQKASSVNIGYTQIDDIIRKQISIEV